METRKDLRNIKEIFPGCNEIIVYAFTVRGVDYFQFEDFNNVPSQRGFAALTYYNELSMRCTRAFLQAHVEAVENILNNNKGIKITELAKLNSQLKERLDWITEIDISYKLCTVVFFDASEDPKQYDFKHGIAKGKIFAEEELESFFFLQPITRLLPYTGLQPNDLRDYLELQTKLNQQQLANIGSILSELQKKTDWAKELQFLSILASQSAK